MTSDQTEIHEKTDTSEKENTKSIIHLRPFESAEEAVKDAARIYAESVHKLEGHGKYVINELIKLFHEGKIDLRPNYFHDPEQLELIYDVCGRITQDILEQRYPIIVIRPYYYHDNNRSRRNVNFYQRSPNFYGATFTKLGLESNCEKIIHELERVQYNIGYGSYPWAERRGRLIEKRAKIPVYVGESATPIPITFAFDETAIKDYISEVNEKADNNKKLELPSLNKASETIIAIITDLFCMPDLMNINDNIVDAIEKKTFIEPNKYKVIPSTFQESLDTRYKEIADYQFRIEKDKIPDNTDDNFNSLIGEDIDKLSGGENNVTRKDLRPLAFYNALRTDFSYGRLEHYTHTKFDEFQPYVLLTNYKKYIGEFIRTIIKDYVMTGKGALLLPGFSLNETFVSNMVDSLKDWYKEGSKAKNALRVDQEWTENYIAENMNGTSHNDDNKLISLTLDQWVEIWTNNCPSQMPAYHFVPNDTIKEAEEKGLIKVYDTDEDDNYPNRDAYAPGVTIVNIGVGPSNAKNITDHLAVLRPEAWIMIGHCGGLRTTQQIGDFVLAQTYVRDDKVLDEALPPYVPIPELQEVTESIQTAASDVLFEEYQRKHKGQQKTSSLNLFKWNVRTEQEEKMVWVREHFRDRVRIGTVYTIDDRNWELNPLDDSIEKFEKSRAVAIDMESATIAANGLRHRTVYGSLLCVSDRPIFGAIKLRGMASEFYQEATETHLQIGIKAIRYLLDYRYRLAASRKLHGFDDPLLR